MNCPPLLVFDLDGTLVDTAGDLISTLNHILAAEHISPLPLETARPMVGAGARALIERGLSSAGRSVSPQRLDEMYLAFLARYEAHIADESLPYPGVEASLDRFEAAGWTFAVCTNKIEHPSVHLLTELGLAARFRAICGQNTFQFCKPDPRALISTIERAGGEVNRAIMVGDSKTDIVTAQAARVPVIAVDFGYTDRHVSEFAPDRVISHFDELWDAVQSLAVVSA
ncbi:MAG: HAD hydrolase-like protein [Methylobacteriaceae bacterium]|nr:HAD hydrolase-like protein [Methylobacteriaceae bacterium]